MKRLNTQDIIDEFGRIRDSKPLVFLDYDGTLVPIITEPEKSFPDPELLKILDSIEKKFEMFIVTGRSLREMDRFLGNRYNIIALHGAVISTASGIKETVNDFQSYVDRCDGVFRRRQEFQDQFPGVQLINKDGGVVFVKWHMDPSMHEELDREVCHVAEEIGMSCYKGKMIVEIRIPGPNKGRAIYQLREGRPALIAGDDKTDEDAFDMNSDAFTVKVGDGPSSAKYRIKDYLEFRKFLMALKS